MRGVSSLTAIVRQLGGASSLAASVPQLGERRRSREPRRSSERGASLLPGTEAQLGARHGVARGSRRQAPGPGDEVDLAASRKNDSNFLRGFDRGSQRHSLRIETSSSIARSPRHK